MFLTLRVATDSRPDLLKLLDETELEILNRSMEVMVDQFHTELLPVATQLSARLVCIASYSRRLEKLMWFQCESYLRLAGETLNQEELLNDNIDIEESLTEMDDDKTFAAMGVAKTISTVSISSLCVFASTDLFYRSWRLLRLLRRFWPKSRKLLFPSLFILWIIHFLVS